LLLKPPGHAFEEAKHFPRRGWDRLAQLPCSPSRPAGWAGSPTASPAQSSARADAGTSRVERGRRCPPKLGVFAQGGSGRRQVSPGLLRES
jgi:hypothetical protein